MTLILISAMTRDRVIGLNNALPWNIPDEYEHFLRHVRGCPVIMGRKSYEIFGPDLPDSALVVVSGSAASLPRAEVCRDVATAIRRAGELGPTAFSAGGSSIYRQTLPLADALYLSIVKRAYDGDRHFPEFDAADWTLERTEDHADWEFRAYSSSRR